MFVKIPRELFMERKVLSEPCNYNRASLILALIQLRQSVRKDYTFSLSWLYSQLKLKPKSIASHQKIKEELLFLQSIGLIKFNSDFNMKTSKNVEVTCVLCFDKNFVMITDDELSVFIESIVSNNLSFVSGAFSLFCLLKYRMGQNNICYPSYGVIGKDLQIKSQKTISDYITFLSEDLNLITYDNAGIVFGEFIKNAKNYYVLSSNPEGQKILKRKILQEVEEIKEKKESVIKSKTTNKRKSVKMKINHLNRKYESGGIGESDYLELLEQLESEYRKLQNELKRECGKIIVVDIWGKENPMDGKVMNG